MPTLAPPSQSPHSPTCVSPAQLNEEWDDLSSDSHDHGTPFVMTMHNLGPSAAPFKRPGSSMDHVPCPHCGKELHPHSLKVHITSQHQRATVHDTGSVIDATNFQSGVCVDQRANIFLVRRNKYGAGFCYHVQYCPNGNPTAVACQLKSCQQVMDPAARSGLHGFVCQHLKSVPFLPNDVPQQFLGAESLDFLMNDLRLLKPGRRPEDYLSYQVAAAVAGVPMIVQLRGESYTSCRFLNFSVWDRGERKKWWSFHGRVCATYSMIVSSTFGFANT